MVAYKGYLILHTVDDGLHKVALIEESRRVARDLLDVFFFSLLERFRVEFTIEEDHSQQV